MKSILYVRLPCRKIYPGGLISIADYVHKHSPATKQRIIELSLIPPSRRRAYLKEAIRYSRPDVIAFSWRNIQTFAPNDTTLALDSVFKFDYSKRLTDKIYSVYAGFGLVWDFIYQLQRNISYIKLARKLSPQSRLVVGGTAFSCFPDELIQRLPEGTIGVDGEGERAMLKILEDRALDDEKVVYIEDGRLVRHSARKFIKLEEFTPTDFQYITEIFPEFYRFLDEDVGVQTKRGCPYSCAFCIYNVIEGEKERGRKPDVVVKDVSTLSNRYGVKKIWFTDSQFISSKRYLPVMEELLDRLIKERLDVTWTGYTRIENINYSMARKMIQSGVSCFDISFSGSQKLIDDMDLDYKLTEQMEAFKLIKKAGFSNQIVKLYLALNAPGETTETLLETIMGCKELYELFGREQVYPWIFFLAIQPGTTLEKRMIEKGYLDKDYDPLTYNPFTIKKLLYNPPPLGELIGKSYLEALSQTNLSEEVGRKTLDIIEDRLLASKWRH
jgi:radical SAM superfamily enzyme YgiQ (UPF0313 family)